jgi:hypothetical protein
VLLLTLVIAVFVVTLTVVVITRWTSMMLAVHMVSTLVVLRFARMYCGSPKLQASPFVSVRITPWYANNQEN